MSLIPSVFSGPAVISSHSFWQPAQTYSHLLSACRVFPLLREKAALISCLVSGVPGPVFFGVPSPHTPPERPIWARRNSTPDGRGGFWVASHSQPGPLSRGRCRTVSTASLPSGSVLRFISQPEVHLHIPGIFWENSFQVSQQSFQKRFAISSPCEGPA